MTRRCTMAFLPAALLLAGALGAAELDPLGAIAVQDGGRLKPLDTFTRETPRPPVLDAQVRIAPGR